MKELGLLSPDGAPMQATVTGRHLSLGGWSAVQSDEPLTKLTLIPYGCTNLRVTEFPLL